MYARATSPARAGSRLFAMKPIAVACQSGSQGNRWPSTSRRISRQRIVRSGNVAVASTTVARSNSGSAWRASFHTCRRSTRCRTQTSNATLTTSPMSQAPRQRRLLLGFDGEDNEVADFVDDRAEALAARALCGFSQFLRALAGTCSLVEKLPDFDWFSVSSAGNQFVQGRRSHTRGNHALIEHPRAREVVRRLRTYGGLRLCSRPARAIGWRRGRRRGRSRWWSTEQKGFDRHGPPATKASYRDRHGRQGGCG